MAYSDEVLADAPLAYYRLGESAGATTMADFSGNGRDGLYGSGVTLGATGLLVGDADASADCSGAGNPATVSHGAWLDTATITLEALIQPDSVSNYYSIIDRDDGSSVRIFQFRVTSSGKLEFIFSTPTFPQFVTGATTLVAGDTYHVAATYDGSVARVYVNGVEDASTSAAGSMGTGALALAVGYNGPGTGGFQRFDGRIDEVAYYGTALSAARISAHHTAATTSASVSGTLAAALPALTVNLAGTSTPPEVTGTLAASLPALSFAGTGGSSAAEIAGTLDSTLPILTVNLSGTVAPIGTLAATLPALTTSISGMVAAPGEISGVLAAQLPTLEVLFRGGSATPTTDTFNRSNGRNRSGSGWANQDEPVATVPATLTREPIRVMAQTLPTPTLEKGRPV